jgi:hypothetical protein
MTQPFTLDGDYTGDLAPSESNPPTKIQPDLFAVYRDVRGRKAPRQDTLMDWINAQKEAGK